MAELTIRLVVDPQSGKKNVIIGYESDAAGLPMEHEEDHRKLAMAVLAGAGVPPEEIGELIIEREGADVGADEKTSSSESEAQPQAHSEDQ